VQPKTQASIDDQHSEAILGKLGEKSRLALKLPCLRTHNCRLAERIGAKHDNGVFRTWTLRPRS
jgi:hypothetical protein